MLRRIEAARPSLARIAWIAGLSLAACGDGDGADTKPSSQTSVVEAHLPAPPAQNDPAFSVSGLRAWYLVGDGLTPGNDLLELSVVAPPAVERVDLWIDGGSEPVHLERAADGFHATTDVAALGAGDHELLLSADASDTAFAALSLRRSHAMYVVTSTDWDDADNANFRLAYQEELHALHPALEITHLVGPYTFTDPSVTPERRAQLAAWVLGMVSAHGDEIGLHIHPYCNFVSTTTVPCNEEPSISQSTPDPTGYTVTNESYTEAEFEELLHAADALFEANGLPKPTAYRAGAWTLAAHNLRALASAGFRVDSSAVNWARLEEWQGQPGATLYEWNQEHWARIDDTSQPYYPSTDDPVVDGAPHSSVLELPDNGALVDYVTGDEMIGIFDANWDGSPLEGPRVLSVGWHPPNLTNDYRDRMDALFSHVDRFLAADDGGPVVYATMTEMTKVFPAPEP